MTQSWHDLLFAHWPVPRNLLATLVPAAFELDLFDGDAWLGIVPFYMTNVTPRLLPALPWLSQFPELNVRTYVRAGGKPGVFFFSLDAGNPVAVWVATTLLRLPYRHASMTVERTADGVRYVSRRDDGDASFEATYRPTGPATTPLPGTLEYFLTERYCLYALDRHARPYRLEIHHPEWQLQRAEADIERNSMAQASGLTLPKASPLLHFARRQDAIAWTPSPIER